MVQLSHPYMTSVKTAALDINTWTFIRKVLFLLFATLSKFVIAFLPGNKLLLISWLKSSSTGILEPRGKKSVIASTFSSPIFPEVMGSDAMIWFSWLLSLKPFFFTLLFHPLKRQHYTMCRSSGSWQKSQFPVTMTHKSLLQHHSLKASVLWCVNLQHEVEYNGLDKNQV